MKGSSTASDGLAVPILLPLMSVLLLAPAALAGSPSGPPVGQATEGVVEARLAGAWLPGGVPRFRAAEVDSWTGGVDLRWQPHARVGLDLRAGLRADRSPLGNASSGPDEVVLATRLHPLPEDWLPVDLELAWAAHLPWSFDAGEVGTDETEVHLLADLGRDLGPVRLDLALGLAILGNPLRFADQDDVPLVWGMARWAPAGLPLQAHLRVGGEWHTPRNPDRMEAVAGLETACPWRIGAEGGPGLGPASPDLALRAWVGWAAGCRRGAGD